MSTTEQPETPEVEPEDVSEQSMEPSETDDQKKEREERERLKEEERLARKAEEEKAANEATGEKIAGGPLHFTIKKAALQNALEKASTTVGTKENEPLLKTFNIEADDDQVRILSTDHSLGSIAKIRVAQIHQRGAICVHAQSLLAKVRSADDVDIEFKVEDKQAVINAGRARWITNVLDAAEYPNVPRFDPTSAEEVDREKFLDAIEKVRYAASTEQVRSDLMLIAFNGDRVAASDGSRLQWAAFKGLKDVQIPIFAVNNLVRLLRRTEVDRIKVELKPHHLLFQIGADTFSTQRLFESFPDVESAILEPAEQNDKELTLDKQLLISAVNRVRLAADEERMMLEIQVLEPANGGLPDTVQLSCSTADGELAVESLPCSTSLEAGRFIYVNHNYFMDALQMNPAKQLTIRLGVDRKQRRSPLLMAEGTLKSVLLQLRPPEAE